MGGWHVLTTDVRLPAPRCPFQVSHARPSERDSLSRVVNQWQGPGVDVYGIHSSAPVRVDMHGSVQLAEWQAVLRGSKITSTATESQDKRRNCSHLGDKQLCWRGCGGSRRRQVDPGENGRGATFLHSFFLHQSTTARPFFCFETRIRSYDTLYYSVLPPLYPCAG